MKQTILVFLVSVLFLYSSCNNNTTYPSKFLDVEEHSEMWAKWKELNIKNYSFTYSCSYWIGYPSFVIVGNVTVKDGVGKVVFKDNDWESEIMKLNLKRSYYHITSMEEVFQHILDKNEENKNGMDEKRWQKVWYTEMDYDVKSFFPRHISYSLQKRGYKPVPHSNGYDGGPHERFDITDFKVLE